MERTYHESYSMAGKGEASVVNYHQIVGREDDEGLSTRYSPRNPLEGPKSVLERGLHFSKFSIHIIALATTAAVVGVNFRSVYGWDQGTLRISDVQVNNLLQFAAKLHELLIVGSLTSMVMHRIRKRLCSSKGLAFGLLSSGYQVSSAEFLLSKSLWSAFSKDWWFILTLAATIIFANVVDPSSAIVMIPRLDWWNENAPFNVPLRLYLDSSLDQLYPTNLGPPNMTLYPGCDTAAYKSSCPGAAFNDLEKWAASWYNNGVAPNISMTEGTTNVQRAMLTETLQLAFDEGPNNTTLTSLQQQKGWNHSDLVSTNMSLGALEALADSSSTPIDFTIERYGYGYGYQDGTVIFGLVVLLTHAAVAIAYISSLILHRVFGTRPFISSAWGEMGEMLALALHSDRARELQNVGGGVEESSTWKLRVRVRERRGDRLELVVGSGDIDSARPKLGKKYQ